MSDHGAAFASVKAALLAGQEIALLDLREEGPFALAHPLFAASLPLGRLEMEVYDRVPRRSTPIVLLDDGDGALTTRGCSRLRRLGYSRVSVFPGGVQAWAAAGGELFRDVNVPSKAFGELVESRRHTPSLSAREVAALIAGRADVAILDARRREEFETMAIPTAVNVPGAELVYRVGAIAPDPATLVIVNCAGRTRSIIGAQSLVNAGIPNRVAALRNGTIGWTLDGLTLERGARRAAPAVEAHDAGEARLRARRVADFAGVRRLDRDGLSAWHDGGERTTYQFDVRSPAEYAAGHLPSFLPAPGGQLVQETDVYAPVRGARMVLWDHEGARADMTASWLAQMGWEVAVLDGVGADEATVTGAFVPARPEPEAGCRLPVHECSERLQLAGTVVVDVASSADYARGHIPGAWLLSRTRLEASVDGLPAADRFIVTSGDGVLAAFAAPELASLTGRESLALQGGTDAWRHAGFAVADGLERVILPPADAYKRPYEGTDNAAAAMQGYLDWEYGLVAQLARDGTHRFRVLEQPRVEASQP